jgi:hypothetical protein
MFLEIAHQVGYLVAEVPFVALLLFFCQRPSPPGRLPAVNMILLPGESTYLSLFLEGQGFREAALLMHT